MLVFVLLLLLVASILGVLGAVLKAAVVIIFAIILAFLVLVGGTFWYLRYRVNQFVKHMDHGQHGQQQRGYPAEGRKGPSDTGRLPE